MTGQVLGVLLDLLSGETQRARDIPAPEESLDVLDASVSESAEEEGGEDGRSEREVV